MAGQSAFTLSIDDQNLAWLAIDVPGEKMNTLQAEFSDEMQAILLELEAKRTNSPD